MTVTVNKSEITTLTTQSTGSFDIININEDGTILVSATSDMKKRYYEGVYKYVKYGTKTYQINGIKDGGIILEQVEIIDDAPVTGN